MSEYADAENQSRNPLQNRQTLSITATKKTLRMVFYQIASQSCIDVRRDAEDDDERLLSETLVSF